MGDQPAPTPTPTEQGEARVTGEQAQALATWIEGNVWPGTTVAVADLLRVLETAPEGEGEAS